MVLRHACRMSLEGIVSKLRDAPYREGCGKAWVKSKCAARQDFVIAGFTRANRLDYAIGSLVLGVFEGQLLRHVGTGFSHSVAQDLYHSLQTLRIDRSPFDGPLTGVQRQGVTLTAPELVAKVEFRAWTADKLLRHASFYGLREDKPAAEVVRKKVKDMPPSDPLRRVKLTHPDRIYWPDVGVTKEDLAEYYAQIWPAIAPFIVHRPLALLRAPTGITGTMFFQKHAWKGMSAQIAQVQDPKAPQESWIEISDLDGLMALVQSAALEIHPWGAALEDWERPDMIVMDLDPGEGASWQQVIDAAMEVRHRLEAAGLATFVKTSGGKGLHVVSPLKPHATWAQTRAFTKAVAEAMSAESPHLYVATVSKAKRKGKILIDYLRNQRGATAVAPYSSRARSGAAVSTPLAWEELGPKIGPDYFTVRSLPQRLAALRQDPWQDFRACAKILK